MLSALWLTLAFAHPQHLDDNKPEGTINEALQQIAFSDLILLNKTDLVTEQQKAHVLSTIRKINTVARVVEVQLNDPTQRPCIDNLLGINSFSIDRALEVCCHGKKHADALIMFIFCSWRSTLFAVRLCSLACRDA